MTYIDTSALLKRYLPERNSDAFDEWFVAATPASVSRLTFVEVRSALARRRREQTLNAAQEASAMNELRIDVQDGVLAVQPGADHHFVDAFHLIDRLDSVPLRTLDALHLAIAGASGATTLATADAVMRRAAEALGMNVIFFGD